MSDLSRDRSPSTAPTVLVEGKPVAQFDATTADGGEPTVLVEGRPVVLKKCATIISSSNSDEKP